MIGCKSQVRRLLSCIAVGALPAAAQCSMCRTALSENGGAAVFNKAILILLLPAMVLFSGTFLVVYRGQRRGNDQKPEE
jgi:hypothetical protein